MKINIELNRESVREFFNDVYEEDVDKIIGSMPMKLDDNIYDDFFKVKVDLRDEVVKISCPNVFARLVRWNTHKIEDYEDTDYEKMDIEISEQEKMLFLVAGDAFFAGKGKVLSEQENGIEVIDPRKERI